MVHVVHLVEDQANRSIAAVADVARAKGQGNPEPEPVDEPDDEDPATADPDRRGSAR